MSELAYEQFLSLPVGALFTSTADWGENDAFIKADAEHYRRTYDYITWKAAETWHGIGIRGGDATLVHNTDNWPGIRTMAEVPKWISHNPPLTEEQCREHEAADGERLRKYIERTGELPEMGFW
jgi:hypothetical protein